MTDPKIKEIEALASGEKLIDSPLFLALKASTVLCNALGQYSKSSMEDFVIAMTLVRYLTDRSIQKANSLLNAQKKETKNEQKAI